MSTDMGIETYECMDPPDTEAWSDPELDDLDLDDLGIECAPPPKAKPIDPIEALGVLRDRWGRPMLLPDPAWNLGDDNGMHRWPDRQVHKYQMADGRRPFTRISTACAWNDMLHGLSIWKLRHAMLSLARRPDAQALLCGLTYKDGAAIDSVMDELLVRASDDGSDPGGELTAANRGTAFHGFSVPGAPPIHPVYGPHIAAYDIATKALDEAYERAGLEPLVHEQFAVDHKRNLAGTVDHLVRVVKYHKGIGLEPGSVHALDKKTGKYQWITHITQVAMYNRSRPTDWRTGTTTAWHPDLDEDHAFVAAVNLESGKVLIHRVNTPEYLVDAAVDRYRNSTSDHVKSLYGKGV